jgi:ribosomal protein S18 acetylase RimI-like enzyme
VGFEIAAGSAGDIDDLRTLWLQMLSYHRDLVCDEFPVWPDGRSWERARRAYGDWLASDTALLVIARNQASPVPLGYAVCRLLADGPTFELGGVRGEVDSLVVDDQARGQGIGTALLCAVQASLIDRGVSYWSVGLLSGNTKAAKLYERVGFRPWTQQLLASTRKP